MEEAEGSTRKDPGVVYALRNEAMPGLVKIGRSNRDTEQRMREIYGTGVPLPFECIIAREVENATMVEKALHQAFGPYRINPKREFFQIGEEQVEGILNAWPGEDRTEKMDQETRDASEETERRAAGSYRRRRPSLRYEEMGIPVGAVLEHVGSGEQVTVLEENQVPCRDRAMSLTAATRTVMGMGYSPRPGPDWSYEGRRLRDIYEETYGPTP